MLLSFKCSLVVTDLHALYSLVLAGIIIRQIDSYYLLMRKNLSDDDQVLQGHLVENVEVVFIVLVNDQSDVRTGKLKVERFLFLFLVVRLRVVVGHHVSQFAIVGPCS